LGVWVVTALGGGPEVMGAQAQRAKYPTQADAKSRAMRWEKADTERSVEWTGWIVALQRAAGQSGGGLGPAGLYVLDGAAVPPMVVGSGAEHLVEAGDVEGLLENLRHSQFSEA
jgi:hypothetical protein